MVQVYIDIHTHRNPSSFPDVKTVWNNILNKDQEISYSGSRSAGLHPWYISEKEPFNGISALRVLLQHDQIIAVGECGLDKAIEISLPIQQEVFREQISLAQQYHKPLIIHCVRAFEEVLYSIKTAEFKGPVVFHGFNKNKIVAEQLIKRGYYLSFGAAILTGKLDAALIAVPIDQLFFETDDKELDIRQLYFYTAQLKGMSLDNLKNNILKNYQLVFE
ncbi:TatD family hydrolase [Sphingobacterium sp. SG20118]|uniref:TatD family hydrolase n=1 Tax=Sphingobacterium sp. SG20118 TaxID=3367156 RepID=UPI0037DFBF25